MNEPNGSSPQSGGNGPAIFAGILLGPLLMYAMAALGLGGSTVVIGGVLAVGAIVLIAQGEPPWRGLGIGVLIGFALILLAYGALFAMCMAST